MEYLKNKSIIIYIGILFCHFERSRREAYEDGDFDNSGNAKLTSKSQVELVDYIETCVFE